MGRGERLTACGHDLVEEGVVGEVFFVDAVPAAEVVDGEERDGGELSGVARGDFGVARTEVVPGDDLLRGGGVEVVEEGFGDVARAAAFDDGVHDGHWRFGEDAE